MSAPDFELSEYSQRLFDACVIAVPGWITSRMQHACLMAGGVVPEIVTTKVVDIARATQAQVQVDLMVLLSTDVDAQRTNPLHVLRGSTSMATALLVEAGIPMARRDEFEIRAMPDDMYAFGPLTWRDLGDDVHDAGIEWGAWKAAMVIGRRRDEGKLSS
ncbi:MAG: hypothetical protein EXQ63_04360 [Ilumatobacteraceae bacterium]|nr:hypothetical protein [Ilumatobacteraceae bacterium]